MDVIRHNQTRGMMRPISRRYLFVAPIHHYGCGLTALTDGLTAKGSYRHARAEPVTASYLARGVLPVREKQYDRPQARAENLPALRVRVRL